jgi:hypothetical protein
MKWRCKACGAVNPEDDWEETEVGCDDCGTHPARECPACGVVVDIIWSEVFIEGVSE